jgi:aspartyl-tRNA(Asn)/glutamyl-tRNA(Gln) amidotransferase subunit A
MNDLAGLDSLELRRRLDTRDISARELLLACSKRIESLDSGIHAFLRLNPRAEDEAAAADRRLAAGERGALLGLPVALKDNLLTAGLETTCASRILEGFVPPVDATVVSRLRRAGAVVLGKTNLDEFAMGSSTENSAFGPTRNPYDPSRVPGGSSGGSAAAVAAGMTPLALGSDTGGSVRQPAALCGVVGLKPTYGRVSRSGLVAFASSMDQVGPLARSVAGCAWLLEAIAGPDPADGTCLPTDIDELGSALGEGVRGLRIGMPREYLPEGLDPEIADAVHRAAAALEAEGATVEEVSLPHTRWAIPCYVLVAFAEASSNLARFDGVRFGNRLERGRGLRAMYAATRGHGFGREVKRRIVLGTYALSAGYHARFYGRAQTARTRIRRDFLDVFGSGFDLLLTPTTPTPAFQLGERAADPLAMYLSDTYTVTANLAGIPALSVPVGLSRDGLPLAAQLLGPDLAEPVLLRAGTVLESALGRLDPAAGHTR